MTIVVWPGLAIRMSVTVPTKECTSSAAAVEPGREAADGLVAGARRWAEASDVEGLGG